MMVLGIDPHKKTHTAVAVDEAGRQVGGPLTVPARQEGHQRLLVWAQRFNQRRWAVEDVRHVAGGLLGDLIAAGETVVAVPPKLMAGARASARTRGKSDPIDALAVARAAVREPDLPQARLDEQLLPVRLLADHRDDLVAHRTQMINRLRWHLHALDPQLDPPSGTLNRASTQRKLTQRLAALPEGTRQQLAVELVQMIAQVTVRINQLERQLATVLAPLAPRLLTVRGVGTLTAATIVGQTAGVSRFKSRDAYAMHTGTAPIPVWSASQRHRLNHGGNRQLNAALHRIALTQARDHPPAQKLLARRRHDHHETHLGAMRILKRRLSNTVYEAMLDDEQHRPASTTLAA